MGELVTVEERWELKEAVKDIRVELRERLSGAGRLVSGSKLAKKVGVLLLDIEALDERVKEAGGEETLVFIICAQVASGVSLTDWCGHYGLERGLVWAFLTQKDEWTQRYYRALEGVADGYIGEVVGISDSSDPERMGVDKLRIETRMKVASKYANGRFGDKPVGVAVQNNITIVHESQ